MLNSICINLNLFFFLNSWSWQVIQRRSWRMPKSLDFKKFLLYLIHHTLHNGKSVSQSKYNSGFGQAKVNFPWVFFAVVQREFPRIVLIGYQTIVFILLFFRNVISKSIIHQWWWWPFFCKAQQTSFYIKLYLTDICVG